MMKDRKTQIIDIIHREVKPALGCTEPIAVALAVAKAVEIITDNCPCICPDGWRLKAGFSIDVAVSGNILKNGMGVGIPGTGMVGLPVAAALGAVCGESARGLEVLSALDDAAVARAKELVAEGMVHIHVAPTDRLLYVKATVSVDGGTAASAEVDPHAYAVIEDDHDRIVETSFADKILMSSESGAAAADRENDDYGLTVREIYDFAGSVPFEDIAFILEDRTLNLALAQEGLKGDYGLKVGKAIRENQKEVFGDDFMSYAMGLTAAASDARMAGSTLPAMSNSGSGNQGITVSIPVIAYAMKYGVDDERLARALILSNLVAIHIKSYLGKLSALCGCVVASTGSACQRGAIGRPGHARHLHPLHRRNHRRLRGEDHTEPGSHRVFRHENRRLHDPRYNALQIGLFTASLLFEVFYEHLGPVGLYDRCAEIEDYVVDFGRIAGFEG